MPGSDGSSGLRLLELACWRAATAELYAAVRRGSESDAQGTWDEFRGARAGMFRLHPQSPLEREARQSFRELPYFPYDPSWRVRVPVTPLPEGAAAPPRRIELAEGTFTSRPFATVTFLPPRGLRTATLTLYWIEGYGGGLFLPFRVEAGERVA